MANSYYVPGEERAGRVHKLFGAIAARYDLLNDLQSFGLHRIWKRKLVRLLDLAPGERALDLCSGTGDIAIAMARRGASVVGLDFSSEMLAVARRKAAATSMEISWQQGDARALPFEPGEFSIVTIGYGLRNLPSPVEGLREMGRVLQPGGRVGILDFGKPPNRFWQRLFFGYLWIAVPCFGRCFAGDAEAYAYILESLRHYPGQQEIARIMEREGFMNVRVLNLLGGTMAIHLGRRGDSHG